MVSLKKILNKILKSLTGVETKTLLWTNASPSSSFEPQTISLALSVYDFVEIYFVGESEDNSYVSRISTPMEKISTSGNVTSIGNCAQVITRVASLGSMYVTNRNFYLHSDHIVFNSALYKKFNSSGEFDGMSDTDLVPYKIYGIKGV